MLSFPQEIHTPSHNKQYMTTYYHTLYNNTHVFMNTKIPATLLKQIAPRTDNSPVTTDQFITLEKHPWTVSAINVGTFVKGDKNIYFPVLDFTSEPRVQILLLDGSISIEGANFSDYNDVIKVIHNNQAFPTILDVMSIFYESLPTLLTVSNTFTFNKNNVDIKDIFPVLEAFKIIILPLPSFSFFILLQSKQGKYYVSRDLHEYYDLHHQTILSIDEVIAQDIISKY